MVECSTFQKSGQMTDFLEWQERIDYLLTAHLFRESGQMSIFFGVSAFNVLIKSG